MLGKSTGSKTPQHITHDEATHAATRFTKGDKTTNAETSEHVRKNIRLREKMHSIYKQLRRFLVIE